MIEKISIDQYPKDTAPVVLLWNDEWANPVVGYRADSVWLLGYPIYGSFICGDFASDAPTHFSYLQEEG